MKKIAELKNVDQIKQAVNDLWNEGEFLGSYSKDVKFHAECIFNIIDPSPWVSFRSALAIHLDDLNDYALEL